MSNRDRTEMHFYGHLKELRKRILLGFFFFLLFVVIGFVVANPIIRWLKPKDLDWNVFAPGDALGVYMKVAFVIGLVGAFPFILYQIWAFVRPGLKPVEQKVALRFIPIASLLFIAGIAFSYFVLFPMILNFMLALTESIEVEMLLGINQYFGFLFNILVPFALLFELPIIVMFLTRLRILNPIRMGKFRKYAYFLLILIAVTITPPELITDILVTLPLLLLYEFSIWLSKLVYRKQLAAEQELEAESRE
jgi:sec-independent protein translocase protein TatC